MVESERSREWAWKQAVSACAASAPPGLKARRDWAMRFRGHLTRSTLNFGNRRMNSPRWLEPKLPPLLEALGLVELTHEPRNNLVRAASS